MIPATTKVSLVDIRLDDKAFPRIYKYSKEEAISNMNGIIMMAFQFRGQQSDASTIVQMSASLLDILLEDEYGIGTRFLTFEEIKRVIRKAVLGQSKEMFGVSVSSLFQALADYCKGEGKDAHNQARREIASRKSQEMRDSIVGSMVDSYTKLMIGHDKV